MNQLVYRMNQMIENNIQEYPGDNATLAEFFDSIRCMFETTKKNVPEKYQENQERETKIQERISGNIKLKNRQERVTGEREKRKGKRERET